MNVTPDPMASAAASPSVVGTAVAATAFVAASAVAWSRPRAGDSPSAWRAARAVLWRDLRLAARRRTEALLPLAFFVAAAGIFPFGVGAEPQVLRQIGAGVVWVCALLAALQGLSTLFQADHADGSLEQMRLCGHPLWALVAAKVAAHWITTALPLLLAAPLLGLLFGLGAQAIAVLAAGLLLGTPVLAGLGAFGAALTLGLRGGASLVFLLVLPLAVPVLIFGAGAVTAVEQGMAARAHLQMLAALLLVALPVAPLAIAAALRISME